jgi:hypothetical protein
MSDILAKARGNGAGVPEIAKLFVASEGRGGEGHHGNCTDDHQHDTDPEVGALVTHEARRDTFVDDIDLLEEKLPRGNCGADDGDDQQHDVAELAALGELRHDKIMRDLANGRVYPERIGTSSRLPKTSSSENR